MVNSAFCKDPFEIGWDEWDETDTPAEEKPKEYLNFITPPLALVIAMQKAGKMNYDIHTTLENIGKPNGIGTDTSVTTENQKRAQEIYEYFQKKHTLRRLKNQHVSKFMLAVDELCENKNKVALEHVKVLVSLPRIYRENRKIESIIKDRISADKYADSLSTTINEVVKFAGKVELTNQANFREFHYFFCTDSNHLVRIVVKKGDYGDAVWNFLSKSKKIRIDSLIAHVHKIRGYEFNVIQPSPDMQISIVE